MDRSRHTQPLHEHHALLRRLASDASGNTLAMIAAGVVPLLAMVGGGVDMGRSYLAQSRLQQACDSGVLAARKKLGSDIIITGELPPVVSDVGMIWGGRLLSGSGIFAADNQDVAGKPTARHMIFLTDGETQALDVTYGAYGVEPLDRRRWDPAAPKLGLSLTGVVERRFAAACNEVKKKNITVWVIGFGTSLNPIMTECAGPGRSFEAANSAELSEVFSKIAESLGDLRISK
ncbi:TadE/TadG family type IV pilus assembly protein [Novosphingobium sp.]|uniref:TadE/TadG family type IV pilus assembly protein n=1 Tax=Novosphingobium sp. TaxID=1874826 RepID=UPI002733E8A8|nr:TadE/TadG family type IV pilus assembly protein [Novosphingobium sp.]MDP3907503.1 pilus assembly protein [Novosphingobium sp.]